MASIKEHDRIVLTRDCPDYNLAAGDVGVVVHIHPQGKAYEVEFMAPDGATIAVVMLEHDQLRPVTPGDISHAQHVA